MENVIMNLYNDILNYDFILFGFGSEINSQDIQSLGCTLDDLSRIIEHKNYFIVSSGKSNILCDLKLNKKRIAYPYLADKDENESKQWDLYNKWLSATMGKKLLLVELGEGFNNPNIIRWPFERITMINNSAKMYRSHSTFYQIPKELNEKAVTIEKNGFATLKELVKCC